MFPQISKQYSRPDSTWALKVLRASLIGVFLWSSYMSHEILYIAAVVFCCLSAIDFSKIFLEVHEVLVKILWIALFSRGSIFAHIYFKTIRGILKFAHLEFL